MKLFCEVCISFDYFKQLTIFDTNIRMVMKALIFTNKTLFIDIKFTEYFSLKYNNNILSKNSVNIKI